jgi:hypothetical protein
VAPVRTNRPDIGTTPGGETPVEENMSSGQKGAVAGGALGTGIGMVAGGSFGQVVGAGLIGGAVVGGSAVGNR